MHHQLDSDYSAQKSSTSAGTSSTHCNLWLLSGSTSSSTASASTSSAVSKSSHEIQLGFRATMVTVDRSGWFRPQFFKNSGAYYHINEKTTWSKWPENIKSMEDLKTQSGKFGELKGLLPAFPVAYIICKV